ncbi:MAG: VWA domain-containing protein [Chloroflexia bacterium]
MRAASGLRDAAIVHRRRGKYTRPRFPNHAVEDVALDATLRAAAARTVARGLAVLAVQPEDLREKVRRHRSPYVIAFVVDNSWSIHVEKTLERVKAVVLDLLRDAYHHHDRIALVAFRHSRKPDAAVFLPPTSSLARAAARLRRIPVSGSTPLPDAIWKACRLLCLERLKHRNAIPVLALVTDGLPNVAIRPGDDPYEEVAQLCRRLVWERIATLVVDTEPTGHEAGRSNCRQMAALSRGKYLTLSRLTRRALQQALQELQQAGRSPAVEASS